jgi:hypothetical protein
MTLISILRPLCRFVLWGGEICGFRKQEVRNFFEFHYGSKFSQEPRVIELRDGEYEIELDPNETAIVVLSRLINYLLSKPRIIDKVYGTLKFAPDRYPYFKSIFEDEFSISDELLARFNSAFDFMYLRISLGDSYKKYHPNALEFAKEIAADLESDNSPFPKVVRDLWEEAKTVEV